MLPHGFQLHIQLLDEGYFKHFRPYFVRFEVFTQVFKLALLLVIQLQHITTAIHDLFHIIQHRIAFDLTRSTERLVDLTLDVLGCVFHENSRIRVGFGHFLLALLHARQHGVRENNGLVLDLEVITLFPREHVYFPLVQSQLAHIRSQEEDVRTLHGRLQHLSGLHVVTLLPAHDRCTPLHAGQVIVSGNVDDCGVIFVRVLVDELARP